MIRERKEQRETTLWQTSMWHHSKWSFSNIFNRGTLYAGRVACVVVVTKRIVVQQLISTFDDNIRLNIRLHVPGLLIKK